MSDDKNQYLLKHRFKYDLVNGIINTLLGLSSKEYKELSKEFMIGEFYLSLKEILEFEEWCTESINKIFENES